MPRQHFFSTKTRWTPSPMKPATVGDGLGLLSVDFASDLWPFPSLRRKRRSLDTSSTVNAGWETDSLSVARGQLAAWPLHAWPEWYTRWRYGPGEDGADHCVFCPPCRGVVDIIWSSCIVRKFFHFKCTLLVSQRVKIWGPFLVVAPASTLNNWHQEFRRFLPSFKVLPYWGNISERKILRMFWNQASGFWGCMGSNQELLLYFLPIVCTETWSHARQVGTFPRAGHKLPAGGIRCALLSTDTVAVHGVGWGARP